MRTFIEKNTFLSLSFIAMVSIALHWKVFPLDLIGAHNIRQAQTQWNIQNFYRRDFNILNPRINNQDKDEIATLYRYEFPIMQWSVAAVYKLIGRESFLVTRIMMFLIGLGSVAGMFYLLKYLFDDPLVAWAGAWALNFSPTFYFYTTCPMPDNLALFGAIAAMAFFFRFLKTKAYRDAIFSAFFLSLGTSAKLPFIVFAAAPAFYLLSNLFKNGPRNSKKEIWVMAIYILFMLPTLAWYAWVIPTWSNGVIAGVFDNKISMAQVLDILDYHIKTMFPEKLINWGSVPFILASLFYLFKNKAWKRPNFSLLAVMGLSVLAYWIYEFNMIEKVHDYYMMPFLPVLFIIAAYGIKQLILERNKLKWLFLAFLVTLPSFGFNYTKNEWSLKRSGINLDAFRYKDDLRKAVPNDAKCIIIQDVTMHVFSYLIDKRGYTIVWETLDPNLVKALVNDWGIRYMYSNSRKMDDDPKIKQFLDELIMERGSIRVYKFKYPL